MKIGTTYPAFNYDIERSFRDALGTSTVVIMMNSFEDIEESDLIVFPGGEDVGPNLYNKQNTHSHGINNNRDSRERFFYKHAKSLGKPMFGTCRGLQFLAVMLGFELIQDIYCELEQIHRGGHELEKTVESIVSSNFATVNSLHHQGLYFNMDVSLLRRYKDRGLYVTSMYKNIVESFESTGIIATQFHPEFMYSKESRDFFTDLGKWVETPSFTFNEKEYNNILRFSPKPEERDTTFNEWANAINPAWVASNHTATLNSRFEPSYVEYRSLDGDSTTEPNPVVALDDLLNSLRDEGDEEEDSDGDFDYSLEDNDETTD